MGDEHFTYYMTDAGETIVRDSLGYRLVEDDEEWQTLLSEANGRRKAVRRKVGSAANAPLGQHGVKRVPVVLVSFADKDFAVGEDAEAVNRYYHLYCNGNADGSPYTGHGSKGSLREYFTEQSRGEFQPEFTAIGPVKLDKGYAYYGANSADGKRKDINYDKFCSEAISKATAAGTDWSLYDNDGDGAVDLVMFVFAGLGESNSTDENAIWPKEVSGASTIGGIRFAANSSVCESRMKKLSTGEYISIPDGVGVFVHELSHALGLPDFYDTRGTCFGMDYWSVMDYGEYANNGFTPVGYTAYERDFMGWQKLQTVSEPTTLHLLSYAKGGCGWKVVSDFNTNEYYILENRQADGWDVKMCGSRGHGLMITHVDYSSTAWTSNTVNVQANHQRMTIIPADGKLSHYNTAGDTWPGTSKKTALTDSSNPAAKLYNLNSNGRKFMGHPIENIAEKDGLISFTFDGGKALPQLATPTALPATQVTASGFTAQWQKVEGATSYEVQLTATGNNEGSIEESILLDENFKGFNNGKTQDGTQDVANKLDEYTQTAGWTGLKLFTTPRNEVKMGSSSVAGRLTTPAISPSNDVITVVIVARWFNEKNNKLQIGYSEGDGQAELLGKATLEKEDAYFAVPIEEVSKDCQVVLYSSNRAYVSRVIVLDGTFSDDDLSTLFKAPMKTIGKRAQAHKSKSQTVTTAATAYTFTNLTTDATYTYRVRALADGFATSNWSEPIQVSLATGIDEVAGANGASAQPSALYDLLGRRITGTPQRGIYIKDGRKIMVR